MSWKRKLQALGPGILFASTAIGVSHLVQSTRAGADFGFSFLWAIIIANLLKYPFFEYGSRYANVTKKSILHGYLKIGKWTLGVYYGLSFISMFIVTAAVTFVTAGLFGNLFGISESTHWISLGLLVACAGLLLIGNFNVLSQLLKVVGIVLLISTVAAFVMTLIHGPVQHSIDFTPKDVWAPKSQLFLIALMGWMPTAVDLSTWNSLWTEEQMKGDGDKPTLKETLFDFNFGYILSAVLAICFLTLGALLMYGTGMEFSNKAPVFAAQVVELFTKSLGDWSYPIITISAFSVMFSTTLAVMDGYGRAMKSTTMLLFNQDEDSGTSKYSYLIWMIVLSLGSFVVISNFLSNLKQLVDLATIMSFVIAPVIAVINFVVIKSKDVPEEAQPPKWMILLSYAGILYLGGFTIYFLTLFFQS